MIKPEEPKKVHTFLRDKSSTFMYKNQVIDRSRNHLGWCYGFVLGFCLIISNPVWAVHLQEHLDEWPFLRSHLNSRGITLETVNTTDTGSNVKRKKNHNALVIGDIDLLLTLNTEQLMDWKGGTMFLYGLGLYGGNIAEGRDAQGVSNISANNTWKLFEAWYQQNLFHEKLSILAGLYDVTSEFDVISSASELFVNSSFGTNPTFALSGKNGPSNFRMLP